MAVRNIRGIRPSVWIQPTTSATHRLTVTRSDGTVDDITSKAFLITIEDGVTDVIGRFSFELWNPNLAYSSVWTGMEVVRYYSDYASTATSLRFRGRIEKVEYGDNKIKCYGRSESLAFMDITVNRSFTDTNCDTIIKSLVDAYGTGFTYTNVLECSTTLTVNWTDKPFWECVKEICKAANYDCYVDYNKDFHFFAASSVQNQGEAIVHGMNLMEVKDFAEDITQVRNEIVVYGATIDGVQQLYTARDLTSQALYGKRKEVINDENLTSWEQIKEYGDYILENKKDPSQVGEVKGLLLASIQPGQQIQLSSQMNNVAQQLYDIISYKHEINFDRGLYTTVRVNKEPTKFSHIITQIVQTQNQQKQTSSNPYEQENSYILQFDDDNGSHTNTEITEGVLKPTAAAGTWVSLPRALSGNIKSAYLIMVGETLTGATVSISGDGGVTYQSITNKGFIDVTSASGTSLVIKVVFDNADTQIDSISLLYALE